MKKSMQGRWNLELMMSQRHRQEEDFCFDEALADGGSLQG